ncbi:MAG: C40 family peptidase [Burkholderiaceae bacterium]
MPLAGRRVAGTRCRHRDPEPTREGTRTGAELVIRSLALLGVQYRFGGNSPDTGLDCSGLVRHVYQGALGLVLPRRSEEISRKGESVSLDQLRPGDLVFFNTLRRAFSHVGIYIGGNRFVHAPSRGGQVRVEHIDNRYWMSRFNGARRIPGSEAPAYTYAGLHGTPLQQETAAPAIDAAWGGVGTSGSVAAPVAVPGAVDVTSSWRSPY